MRKTIAAIEAISPLLMPVGTVLLVVLVLYYILQKLESSIGAGTPDPGGAVKPNASLLDGAINSTLEVGHSTLSYTDAAAVTATNPVSVAESIIGMDQTATAPAPTHDALWYASFGLLGT